MAIIFCILLAVAIPLAVLMWKGAEERKVTESEIAAVRSLSPQAAEEIALHWLRQSGTFETVAAVEPFPRGDVPSHVVSLFSRYQSVTRGEFWLAVDALEQKAALSGFMKIGEDFEFAEILVRPEDQRIYISYGEGPQSSTTVETEETIWHAIIVMTGISVQDAQQALARDVRNARA